MVTGLSPAQVLYLLSHYKSFVIVLKPKIYDSVIYVLFTEYIVKIKFIK